jgi:hypothetical protein
MGALELVSFIRDCETRLRCIGGGGRGSVLRRDGCAVAREFCLAGVIGSL